MTHIPIHELFSQTADKYRHCTALDSETEHRSYLRLETESSALAELLSAEGAAKGSIAAILLDDRMEFITAVIGALKAGCVFVPLSPDVPDQRLELLTAQVKPSWVITESRLLSRVAALKFADAGRPKVIVMGAGGQDRKPANQDYQFYSVADVGAGPRRAAVKLWKPDDICYIYFTSGSSGTPKGIAGRLKAIDHFIRWETETFAIQEGVRGSQLTAPTFDAFMRDIFVPLCNGGQVCILPNEETLSDGQKLVAWLDRQDINLIHCVPSIFRVIINQELTPQMFPALKHIFMAGEILLPADVKKWMEIFGERVQLVNLYGPTETTMTKFMYRVKPSDANRSFIPIGKPIDGARAILMNHQGRVCPPGMIGEIYIRTPFRSLGYYNRPDLTREVFVQNPFVSDPNDLIYKTGDLARILEDGNFEFLGRKDGQVKIRGVRIEPAEIENVLRGHHSVTDVAVTDDEDAGGNKFLCAYLVSDGETKSEELAKYLAERLPLNMLPAGYIFMDALPRTISGKIDRRALPSLREANEGAGGTTVEPRTPTEEIIAGIWANVLRAGKIGVHDNFFALGGHSLLATLVLSRLRTAFGIEVPLRYLFEAPTIEKLALRIEGIKQRGYGTVPSSIKPAPREGILPLSFAQTRLWFMDRLVGRNALYNISSVIRLIGRLQVLHVEKSINEIVRRHEVLRTEFPDVAENPEQVIVPTLQIQVPTIDLSCLHDSQREATVGELIAMISLQPFELSKAPLLRAVLLKLGDQEWILGFTVHHIVADDWSLRLMAREFTCLYRLFADGEKPSLPPLPIQYVDFAVRQREWLSAEVLQVQVEYWKKQLSDLPVLRLPKDRPRMTAQRFNGVSQQVAIPAVLTEELKRLAYRESGTMFMVLLAALKILFYRYTDQNDIVVGTTIANRNRRELEELIGFFANTLVLRTDLSGNPSFREALKRVRETALEAYAHQDLPFEMLVDELETKRDLRVNPLFQIIFTYQNAVAEPMHLPELTLSFLSPPINASKFDWLLVLRDQQSGLNGVIEYNTDLFDCSTVEQMWNRYVRLLESIVAMPEIGIDDLNLYSAEEKDLLQKDTAIEALNNSFAY